MVCSILFSLLTANCRERDENVLEPVTLQLKWFHQFQFAGYYAEWGIVPRDYSLKGFIYDPDKDVFMSKQIVIFLAVSLLVAAVFGGVLLLFNARLIKHDSLTP